MAKNKEALYDELVDIQNKIDHHPMISGPHAEASSLVEIMKEQGYSHEEIEKSLKDQGLPSIVDIGKNTISGMFSLWWLNYGNEFGFAKPLSLNLNVIKIEFGFTIAITVSSIIGMIISILVYSWMSKKY